MLTDDAQEAVVQFGRSACQHACVGSGAVIDLAAFKVCDLAADGSNEHLSSGDIPNLRRVVNESVQISPSDARESHLARIQHVGPAL